MVVGASCVDKSLTVGAGSPRWSHPRPVRSHRRSPAGVGRAGSPDVVSTLAHDPFHNRMSRAGWPIRLSWHTLSCSTTRPVNGRLSDRPAPALRGRRCGQLPPRSRTRLARQLRSDRQIVTTRSTSTAMARTSGGSGMARCLAAPTRRCPMTLTRMLFTSRLAVGWRLRAARAARGRSEGCGTCGGVHDR